MARSNSSAHSPQKTKQKLTKEELLILQSHLEEWKEATGKNRKEIMHAVIQEANMQAPKMDSWLLKKRKLMYWDWLYNRRAEKTLKKRYKKEIIEKTRARPGGKEMIKNYQGAVNAIMAGLCDEQLEEAKKTAIEWSSKAPPTNVQAEFAQKKAPCMMKDLATQLWRQAGMRIFILSAWKTEEGELEGNSFTDTKDWKPMLSEWNAYVGEEFTVDQNDEDDNEDMGGKESGKHRRKKEEFALEVDAYGLPVMPDIEDLSLEEKMCLIHTFLTRHYRFCSQKPKASVPWSAVMEAQDDFIKPKFLPAGVKIRDPSKLQLHEADRLLEFWHQRQKDAVPSTFEFKGWQDHNKEMREPVKRTSGQAEQDLNTEEEDCDEGAMDGMRSGLPTAKTKAPPTRWVEQESSSEGEDGDKGADYGTRSGQATAKARVPVKSMTGRKEHLSQPTRRPTGRAEQESGSEGEDGDEGAEYGTRSSQATAKAGVPVKNTTRRKEDQSRKPTGKPTRQVEQESGSEGEDGEEGAGDGTRPSLMTAKTKVPVEKLTGMIEPAIPATAKARIPVKKTTGKPTGKSNRTMEHPSSGEGNGGNEDIHLPFSTSTSIGWRNRTDQSDSEQEDSVWVRKMHRKEPTPKSTAPSMTQATHKTRKTPGAQVDHPEPKRSARTTKVPYKVNYMQRQ
ncbi:hypothetical protein BDR05DRAFT_996755 [Suillus weaverae]|nr:hypothetical protein BDR05DRAFT_996755 [Suillus weaverae]